MDLPKVFRNMDHFYARALNVHPLRTKSITAGILFFGGDIFCQIFEKPKNKSWKEFSFDLYRALRMTIFGTVVLGPAGHFWYKFLDTKFPLTTWKHTAIKVSLDQLCFSPPFYTSFFAIMPLLEGHGVSNSIENIKQKFLTTYLVDCVVWPPAQTINFRYFKPEYRLLFVSVVSVGWNAFLSWMQHSH